MEGHDDVHWFAPIVADAEAGFGGTLNVFELMKGMIEAGAAGVHFEDQLSSAKNAVTWEAKFLFLQENFKYTCICKISFRHYGSSYNTYSKN